MVPEAHAARKKDRRKGKKEGEPNYSRNEMTLSAQINLRREMRATESYREKFSRARPPLGRLRTYTRALRPPIRSALPLIRSAASDDNEFRFSLVGHTNEAD